MRLIDADSIEFVLAPIAPLLKGVTIDDKPVFRRVALKEEIDKIPAVDQWTSVNDWIPMARYLERSVNSLYSSISHYKKKHDGKMGEMPIVFHGRKTLARIEE